MTGRLTDRQPLIRIAEEFVSDDSDDDEEELEDEVELGEEEEEHDPSFVDPYAKRTDKIDATQVYFGDVGAVSGLLEDLKVQK